MDLEDHEIIWSRKSILSDYALVSETTEILTNQEPVRNLWLSLGVTTSKSLFKEKTSAPCED